LPTSSTRIVDATGLHYTGKYLDELKPPAPGEPWMDEYRLACQRRGPLFGASTIMTCTAPTTPTKFSIFPLRKGGEEIAQIIVLEDHFGYGSAKEDFPPWQFGESATSRS